MGTPSRFSGDFFGAFADTAILLPIIALLNQRSGFRLDLLLFSSGLLYLFSGFIFRIPISIQPLKSIAIASIAVGANSSEIRLSGLLVGLFFTLLAISGVRRIPIPEDSVRAVQTGLGALLMLQALKVAPHEGLPLALIFSFIIASLFLEWKKKIPLLGLSTFLAFAYAIIHQLVSQTLPIPASNPDESTLRIPLILSLVLPQLALTASNSVKGTEIAAQEYFKESAFRVTTPKLLYSIGIGNLITAFIGGLPFCHGSGGLTAHFRGGARTFKMNFVIGGALLLLGMASLNPHFNHGLKLPDAAISPILFLIGLFHLALAKPLWDQSENRILLILSILIASSTGNLLWVLLAALAWKGYRRAISV
jgi:hypothetical protein